MTNIDSTIENTGADFSWCADIYPWEPETTREAWLVKAAEWMATNLFPSGPRPQWRVTCGWPKGVRGGKHAIGQCWPTHSSADGTHEIFISPELDHPITVLATLAHEMVHAIAGLEHKHNGEFVKLCKKIGLVKPWTATTPSPELVELLKVYAHGLGPYPHARLNDAGRKKQTTRLLKASCPTCNYTVRVTAHWVEVAVPRCPVDDEEMVVKGMEDALRDAA